MQITSPALCNLHGNRRMENLSFYWKLLHLSHKYCFRCLKKGTVCLCLTSVMRNGKAASLDYCGCNTKDYHLQTLQPIIMLVSPWKTANNMAEISISQTGVIWQYGPKIIYDILRYFCNYNTPDIVKYQKIFIINFKNIQLQENKM